MKAAHDTLDLPIEKFEKPSGVIDFTICDITKNLLHHQNYF